MQKERLFTQDEALLAIVQIIDEVGMDDLPRLFDAMNRHSLVLHRTLYRDYFSIMSQAWEQKKISADDDAFKAFSEKFALEFQDEKFNFLIATYPQQVAQVNGWPNLLGWDKEANTIVSPLTHVFKVAAEQAFIVQQFHKQALDLIGGRNAYERLAVMYVLSGEIGAGRATYETIVQTQAQVSEFSLRAREKFEAQEGRPMLVSDWDALAPQISQMLMKLAAGARHDTFRKIASVAYDVDPFSLRADEDGELQLQANLISEQAVTDYQRDTHGERFFERYSEPVTTGCPAVFSRLPNGGGYLSHVIDQFMGAVRNDFWPEQKPQVISGGCPFHSSKPA